MENTKQNEYASDNVLPVETKTELQNYKSETVKGTEVKEELHDSFYENENFVKGRYPIKIYFPLIPGLYVFPKLYHPPPNYRINGGKYWIFLLPHIRLPPFFPFTVFSPFFF